MNNRIERKGLYQRSQALKYLKRGFNVIGELSEEADSDLEVDHKELDSSVLFMASIANSLLYIGDQLFEMVERSDVNGSGGSTTEVSS